MHSQRPRDILKEQVRRLRPAFNKNSLSKSRDPDIRRLARHFRMLERSVALATERERAHRRRQQSPEFYALLHNEFPEIVAKLAQKNIHIELQDRNRWDPEVVISVSGMDALEMRLKSKAGSKLIDFYYEDRRGGYEEDVFVDFSFSESTQRWSPVYETVYRPPPGPRLIETFRVGDSASFERLITNSIRNYQTTLEPDITPIRRPISDRHPLDGWDIT